MNIFSPDQLAKIVKETLPDQSNQGDHNAVVASFDQTGAKVVASFTRQHGSATWKFQAAAEHDWNGDNSVGANVLLSWP